MIKVSTPFRYVSYKALLWNYMNQVVPQEPQAVRVSPEKKKKPLVNDIVGTGGLIRSGRCYTLNLSRVKEGEERTK